MFVAADESAGVARGEEGFFFNLDPSKSTEAADESEGGIRPQQASFYGAMGVGAAVLDEPLDPGVGYDTDDSYDASESVDVNTDNADGGDGGGRSGGSGDDDVGGGEHAHQRGATSFYEGDKQRPAASGGESGGTALGGDATGYFQGLLRRVRERTAGMSKHDNAGFKREWQQIERVGTDAKHR